MKILIFSLLSFMFINSYSADKFKYSYYDLMTMKIGDDNSAPPHTSNAKKMYYRQYVIDKITNREDNIILLSANVVMGGLCYIKYETTQPVYGISSNKNKLLIIS